MRKALIIALGIILVLSVFAGSPSSAQSEVGYVTVALDIDMEDYPNRTCIGNGTLLFVLSGQAAGDLGSAVLLNYGELGSITSDSVARYIGDVLDALGAQEVFDTIELTEFRTYQDDMEETETGLIQPEGPGLSDFPPITIRFKFDCRALAYEPSAEVPDADYEPLVDALFNPILSSGEVHPDDYIYEFTSDIRVPDPPVTSIFLVISVLVCVPVLIIVYLLSERRKQKSKR